MNKRLGFPLLISFSAFGASMPPEQPNVILVITDDQGYGDLGCHGNDVVKTPNLDRFHDEAIRLTDFHVSPTCAPTRAALMTGRYANDTGVWHTIKGRSLLRTDEKTLADMFRDAGYTTGFFGKWHLGDNYEYLPQQRGFETVWFHGGGGVGQTPDYWGNDYFDDTYWVNGEPTPFEGFCTEIWFRGAKEFIRESAEENRPFFCYLTLNAPHSPYYAPEKYKAMYEDNPHGVNPAFFGMITQLDEEFGALRDILKKQGLEENTILIFMTDNGTSAGVKLDGSHWCNGFVTKGFNAGMRGKKGTMYDGGHRVPFFIRWPKGGLGGGRDINALTAHIDVLPTLSDLCSVPLPQGHQPLHGTSLVPLLRGKKLPPRTLVVDSQREEFLEKWRMSAVMTERWRLINGRELYDIKADPEQRRDIAEMFPETVLELRSAYEAWWAETSDRADELCRISIDPPGDEPVLLNAMDWHDPKDGSFPPWNQELIAGGLNDPDGRMIFNGVWAVDVPRFGKYRFTLMRWPPERGGAIEDGFFPVHRARIQVGTVMAEQPVEAGAEKIAFELELPAGPAALQTWFEGDERSFGAYYVEVIPE